MQKYDSHQRDIAPALIPIAQSITLSEDDWAGLSNAAERRKRQNRLNQRAHRHRRQMRATPNTIEDAKTISCIRNQQSEPSFSRHLLSVSDFDDFCVANPRPDIKNISRTQVKLFNDSYASGSPSKDHLLSLTRMNVYRAFVQNMILLGISWDWMADDQISPFNMGRPGFDPDSLPVSLRPTYLQQKEIHHTWIDLFPSPVMRDNLLRAGAGTLWDDEPLCTDIMGFWEGLGTGEVGLMLWGDPCDPINWEVSEGFLKKWGWVIRGCGEIILATNRWRALRGERPLFAVND